jgi:hypothetical protein
MKCKHIPTILPGSEGHRGDTHGCCSLDAGPHFSIPSIFAQDTPAAGACLAEIRLTVLGSIILPQRPPRFLPLFYHSLARKTP